MKLKITRIDKSLPSPKYQTPGSVAFDIYARTEVIVQSNTIELIPTNLIVKVPEDYMLMLAARSSLPLKKGLQLKNGVGIIDQDFSGPDDEMSLQVYNFTDKAVKVERGERIGQAVLLKIAKVEFEEIEKADGESRGGFGSTG